jgi:putative serine protease PepD
MIGTGVVLSDDGLIVTSNHVATLGGDEPADFITVYDAEGREDEVTVVAQDSDCDLAFLRTTLDVFVPAPIESDLTSVQPGTPVSAVGAPQRFEEPIAPGVVVKVLGESRSPVSMRSES